MQAVPMKAGAYVLHLSCDHPGCREHGEYTGNRTETEAFKEARRDGWSIGKPWTHPDFCREHKTAKAALERLEKR